MTTEEFIQLVKVRANVRVQEKILSFKRELHQALQNLGIADAYSYGLSPAARELLTTLGGEDPFNCWPKRIWTREESIVKDELLNILDELQKAQLALSREPNENDVTPALK
jgi:hypothetical protein